MRTAATVLSTLAASLIAWAPTTALGDRTADRVALETANQAWKAAFIVRDADAKAALTTDDFILLPPNAAPVRGRDAAHALWRQVETPEVLRISLTFEEIVMDGDVAYSMGAFSESLPNGYVTRHGMFVDIWKRVAGEWRIHRHMLSDSKDLGPVPVKDQPILDTTDPRQRGNHRNN